MKGRSEVEAGRTTGIDGVEADHVTGRNEVGLVTGSEEAVAGLTKGKEETEVGHVTGRGGVVAGHMTGRGVIEAGLKRKEVSQRKEVHLKRKYEIMIMETTLMMKTVVDNVVDNVNIQNDKTFLTFVSFC